jgi:gamma-glutamyltranspeptidase/glutathione hydrolase
MTVVRALLALVAGLCLAAGASARSAQGPALYDQAMVAAANPLAVEAGLAILRQGGSAVDAAAAVQATLGLVEPQSSGLGGGAFMVFYDARTHRTVAYDGREIAPAGATPDMFLRPDGRPMTQSEAVLSGRSAGVPGAVAMLKLAHDEHGRLPWSRLFEGSAQLAEQGFVVSPRLAGMIRSSAAQAAAPDVVAYFSKPDGSRLAAGDLLKNPAYAATLRRIALEGPAALLTGPIAQHIVTRLGGDPTPGTMTLADLASYRPREGPALCRPYRHWTVCEPGAPSGGPAVLEGLGLLAHTDIGERGPKDPQAWYLLSQAERLMYADHRRYVADPTVVRVPVEGLLDETYLADRAKLIAQTAGPAPAPGRPAGAPSPGPDATAEPGGTSSLAIVDRWGNVVAMTTTVESLFGDGRMVDGFFLNNQLTDFSFSPRESDGAPAANAVGPRKRPRSSMAPAIVFDEQGRFLAAVGSPGGIAIPAYVLKALVAALDWKMTMADAVALPNLVALGDYYGSEPAKFAPGVVEALAIKNVKLSGGYGGEGSGLHGIVARDGKLSGGADPRREGVVRGCCGPGAAQTAQPR